MATTTNYGWVTPDDTSLVKDGAAAIRTLGSSVDTTTKALNPSTTLGDVEYRSATANTNTRLAIGTTGQVLTVSGGVPSWTTPAGGGGMTLLSTTTLSGASTVVSSINQTYNDLQIVITNPVTTATNGMQINPNSTAGVSYNQGVTSNVATGSTQLKAEVTDTSSNPSQCIVIRIVNYTDTVNAKGVEFFGLTTPDTSKAFNRAGCITLTAAITSLQFVTVSGTFTSGTVKIYGVK